MQESTRKHSLEEINHRNRQSILLYISEAKVEIYTHCMICYDPNYFQNLPPTTYPSDIYHTCPTPKSLSQQVQLSSNSKSQDKSKDKSKCQDVKSTTEKVTDGKWMGKMPTSTASSLGSQIDEEAGGNLKVLYFNSADLVFYVNEATQIIQIHNLTSKSMELYLQLTSPQVFIIVQSLFRRKLCELGFYDKYRIIKLLGKGGTADVQLVERLSDKKNFAAKIISTANSNDKQFELFVNEAKLLRLLKHPNIIHLESVYIYKTQLIQVLEYLPAGTLLESLKKNQITEKSEKWNLLRNIVDALEYLRQRRIVHRDLKLENCMMKYYGDSKQVIISDFGLASWACERSPVYEKCGTPGYIAPEILNTPPKTLIIDHRSDIFSLGVIAHIFFLHQPLFHFKGSLKQLINDNKKAEYNLSSKKYQILNTKQQNFLALTLNRDMTKRATSEQLLKEINSFKKDERISVEKPKRKMSLDSKMSGVGVQVKRETSLKKKSIEIDIGGYQRGKPATQESESPRKSLIFNAKKMVSNFWQAITPTAKKEERMKVKENSVEKQRKARDFFN